MKKSGGILAVLTIFSFLATPVQKAAAEACANISSFGAVNLVVPTLPPSDTYAVWIRMQSADSSARVLVEVNGSECLELGGELAPNQWVWQTAMRDGQPEHIQLPNRVGNGMRIVGVQAGVRVDRLLVTRPDCVPQDFGENCASPIQLTGGQDEHVELLSPPSDKPVSGKILLTNTPSRLGADLKSVSYAIHGRVLQTSDKPVPFDTTLAENGKYTVNITTTSRGGVITREAAVVEIKNPQNPLSPTVRWLRLNQRSVITALGIVAALLALASLLSAIRALHVRRRQRKFHGF